MKLRTALERAQSTLKDWPNLGRYRDDNGKPQVAATLNGTLATTRWLVAILENHQQPDGSVVLPPELARFVGTEVLEPK
jgi:seryl-tRNA synthetase